MKLNFAILVLIARERWFCLYTSSMVKVSRTRFDELGLPLIPSSIISRLIIQSRSRFISLIALLIIKLLCDHSWTCAVKSSSESNVQGKKEITRD